MIEVIAQASEGVVKMTDGVPNIAFTADAAFVITIFVVVQIIPSTVLIIWLFKMHGRVSKLEGIDQQKRWTEGKSPLSLTDTGKKALIDSGIRGYIDQHKDGLLKKFEGVQNAFDIQQKAREVMKKEFEKSDFDETKNYLYNNSKDFDEAVMAAGVYLRDIVLEERGHKKGVEA